MSRTAFSQHYNRELDLKQLLKLRGVIASVDQENFGLLADERTWMRADLLCPSCGCGGAHPVRSDVAGSGKGNTRQAHFRYVDANGRTAHKIGCDFYPLDDEPGFIRGVDVQFSADERDTKVVRELVCQAISSGAISKTTIFSMRTWFLQEKQAHTFKVSGTPEMIEWLYHLRKLPAYRSLAFSPYQAALPGFSPRRAVERHLAHQYRDLLERFPRVYFDAPARDRAMSLARAHAGQPLIDLGPLRPQYDKTLQLANLMAELGVLAFKKPYRWGGHWQAPKALLAFSATLLFVTDWELDAALSRFADILKAPAPTDLTLGNVMGLNPFHDFAALEILRFASELELGRTYNYGAEFSALSHVIETARLV